MIPEAGRRGERIVSEGKRKGEGVFQMENEERGESHFNFIEEKERFGSRRGRRRGGGQCQSGGSGGNYLKRREEKVKETGETGFIWRERELSPN